MESHRPRTLPFADPKNRPLNKVGKFVLPGGEMVFVQIETCPVCQVSGRNWFAIEERPGWAIKLTLYGVHGETVAQSLETVSHEGHSSVG